ncbi:MAG: T9SS type A sorting domain-containing protein [Saprospiraceae bacterium]|nr:T9SS type A sorting domain-containing protein [Saprospiraceae bacterium]
MPPNPFTDNISIRLNPAAENTYEVRLTDLTGHCMVHLISQSKLLHIPTQKLATGICLLQIQMDGQQWIRKLIK